MSEEVIAVCAFALALYLPLFLSFGDMRRSPDYELLRIDLGWLTEVRRRPEALNRNIKLLPQVLVLTQRSFEFLHAFGES